MKRMWALLLAVALLATPALGWAAANTSPIFTKVGVVQFASVTTAATNPFGYLSTAIFTADPTNGSRCEKLIFQPLGTNIATVARIFVNNGSSINTGANNTEIADVTLPASTANAAASVPATTMQLDIVLPPSYVLTVSLGTTVAAGYQVTAVCGTY